MQEKNKLVEEALIQMKQVEEAIAENAKGILASTMKEEINQLVKESLSEQDDEDEVDLDADIDADTDMDTDDVDLDVDVDLDADNLDDMDDEDSDDSELDFDMDSEEETPIDLTGASDEEILRVFKAMGEEDGIIISKDNNEVHLKDNDADVEYLVKLGESEEEYDLDEEMYEAEDDQTTKIINSIFGKENEGSYSEEDEEVMYEIEFDEQEEDLDEQEEDLDEEEETENLEESRKSKSLKGKSKIKPKGVGIGSGPKFAYKKTSGGFKEEKKEGPKSVGTGKAKFEYKKGANIEGKSKVVKKAETKEAARTLGNGSDFRKGGLPKSRAHSKFNTAIKNESVNSEVSLLREKNDEYRKALNVFREKLNEVAIFNSNLAYATRLFTEHSTTKKEKINILRRFDEVATLKESKSLYKSIKDELSKTSSTESINESVKTKLNKTVSTGSSTTLIESKTYENPQFLRMKDLMSKLK